MICERCNKEFEQRKGFKNFCSVTCKHDRGKETKEALDQIMANNVLQCERNNIDFIYANKLRKIDGFNGYYINEFGDIYSLKSGQYPYKLKPKLKNKYYQIAFYQSEQRRWFLVHRLVAITYIDKPDGKEYINHIDGNKLNNHITNLEWCTHQENMTHAKERGVFKKK